jgi:glycosyltransferase involved in cell wall biosynthesis
VRVAFLTQDLQLSGGVGVVVEHASQLARRHGFDVSIVLTRDQAEPDWAFRGLEHLHVVPLADAIGRTYDVAVSTWWETADYLFDLDAHRYASFVQSLEDRFYLPEEPERMAAALTLDLPVRFVTEARWIARALEALQPGNRALLVRNGIAKDVFGAPAAAPVALHGPLRVLVEGSARIGFKGVREALEATTAMNEERVVTLVTPDRDEDELDEPLPPADRVVRAVPHAEMARLYSEHDVVLKLSRVEGMFGPPLEGFHRGATCVVTPVTGHEEYVRHGVNGMVVDWDDVRGTARTLDLLARDRALLHQLRTGAVATARAWPSWEQAGGFMALALRRIAAEPPPAPRIAGRRLVRDFQANLAVGQRLTIDHTITSTVLLEVREQNAYKVGLWLRGVFLKLTAPVRRVRWWLRTRREG